MRTPRRRRDGRCFVCRKPIVMSQRPGLDPALYSSDPFCSAGCARKHFGTEITRKVVT